MHGSARPGCLSFCIQRRGNLNSLRVYLDDRVELGAISIDSVDSVQVILSQLAGTEFTLLHKRLQRRNIVLPIVGPINVCGAAE